MSGPEPLKPLHIEGSHFVDEAGRKVILRGVNLGGDCKLPFPEGGTHFPTDFQDYKTVSFIGRPFPMAEADEHFSRLQNWGFNCLRLLTTWEAVEHAGPQEYDEVYLDYYAALCAKAADYGLYVFVDFHQDVWSRMSGGSGAPAWCFEKAGIDMTRFHASDAAHVMQHTYDFERGGRQEENYPQMSWSQNYSRPVNGIMWTLFFAGRDFAPGLEVDGQNIQDYLQAHYIGAMTQIARRVKDMPHVIGFDTLNEPGRGFIGQPMCYQHLGPSEADPEIARPGLAWSVLDNVAVSHGNTRTIPIVGLKDDLSLGKTGEDILNPNQVSIWCDGAVDPFAAAGAYAVDPATGAVTVTREDFFEKVDGRIVHLEEDYMGPFFCRVAEAVRTYNADWMVFAELDPLSGITGEGFPASSPDNVVNASHWYDVVTLYTKTFDYPERFNIFSGKMMNGREEIQAFYNDSLGQIQAASKGLNGGAGGPTLIGECGIPFDFEEGAAYHAFAKGDHTDAPWERQNLAQEFLYNALDHLGISSTQWNYTASNRNDLAIGDGWNQEDLSIFSRDQQANPNDLNSGARGLKGFLRPYPRAISGLVTEVVYKREERTFCLKFHSDGKGTSEIFMPRTLFPEGYSIQLKGAKAIYEDQRQLLHVRSDGAADVEMFVEPYVEDEE
ncbi:MAG: cellulase family glycosylhydrolase [Parvibaculaceae bacterium]|nr:cellulase family glycosylhydrolase [Parvibaculaceae bacterium]